MPASNPLDDVCALIGFSATVRLIAWHGGTHIYIPGSVVEDHPLARLMGQSALRALSDQFGGQMLWVPADAAGRHRASIDRKRAVAKLVNRGRTTAEISRELGLSERQVQRIGVELARVGLVPGRDLGAAAPARRAPVGA